VRQRLLVVLSLLIEQRLGIVTSSAKEAQDERRP
jgi:hypothetical protein